MCSGAGTNIVKSKCRSNNESKIKNYILKHITNRIHAFCAIFGDDITDRNLFPSVLALYFHFHLNNFESDINNNYPVSIWDLFKL